MPGQNDHEAKLARITREMEQATKNYNEKMYDLEVKRLQIFKRALKKIDAKKLEGIASLLDKAYGKKVTTEQ